MTPSSKALAIVSSRPYPDRKITGRSGSTNLCSVSLQGDRGSTPTSKNWWCVSPRRTNPGVTTGLPGH